jgi:hypothetical protein
VNPLKSSGSFKRRGISSLEKRLSGCQHRLSMDRIFFDNQGHIYIHKSDGKL